MPALGRRAGAWTTPIVLGVSALVLGSACIVARGPLPGDVLVSRMLQSSFGAAPEWASMLTWTAKSPLVWYTLVAGVILAWLRAGSAGTVATVVAFGAVRAIDPLLRSVTHVPKPDPELVAVAAVSESSGLPSTFALVYGAVFAAALMRPRHGDALARVVAVIGITAIVTGSAARIVLGGHWTSQMIASLCLAFALALTVERLWSASTLGRRLDGV